MNSCALNELRNRLEGVREKIDLSCQSVGRDRNEVKLVVVTKRRSPHVVASLTSLGVKDIGENYMQEAIDKQAALGEIADNFHWHFIGPLQRRKAKFLPQHFMMMHSVDRIEVAQKLNDVFGELGLVFPILLQVNVSGEESKSGWLLPEGMPNKTFLIAVESMMDMPSLKVQGLMTMPPYSQNGESSRPYYVSVRKLAERMNTHLKRDVFTAFSMGTSFDYSVAIEEGATYVRIGEAILGSRE